MNKITLLLFMAIFMSLTACEQKLSEVKVPEAVTSAFKTKFPTATKIKWEMENESEYEAEFSLHGEEVSANFDNTGKWLETETEIKVADLPAAVQMTLTNDFPDFKIEEASMIENVQNGSGYEAEIEKGEETFDVLFAADGKILSKTKADEEKGEKD